MDSARWQQVKRLFEAVIELETDQRAAFLDRSCDGDAALRAEVESLLASHNPATGFLDVPALVEDVPETAEQHAGTRVGPYRIVRELGRGGMGSVYLAERADGQFKQKVALKVVRRGLDTDDILSRFRYERQILASLDHPNIAQLHDGGMTEPAPGMPEGGRPYFAMEYVNGLPITAYCDVNRLTTPQRLALFRTVCGAVQHAHRNLVIHRDLKPSNILVTDDGTVKLLDFGIAKLLDEKAVVHTVPLTRTGQRLMTPEYAAPEQVTGAAVTTATDVYQLGVLLYELLTGRRPYQLDERMRYEIERVILEEEPTRPSTAVRKAVALQEGAGTTRITPEAVSRARSTSVEALQRRLSGDLDTIVLMALKKDPTRRYLSVEQLSEDIHRHLNGLPVQARPDTIGYRVSKFVRRHTVGVAAAVAVSVALVGGIVATAWQARVAAAERDRAQAEAAKAAQINTFLQKMLSSASPFQEGRDVKVVDVLDGATARAETELADQPEIEADILRTIGITYQDLGLYDKAETQLDRALQLRREYFGLHHPETAQSLKDYALVKHWQGDLKTAADYYQRSLAVFRELGTPSGAFAEALNDYGTLLNDLDRYEDAARHFEEALAMMHAVHGAEHIDITSALSNLGLARYSLGDMEAADTLYRQALAMEKRLVGDEHIDVGHTLNNLAWIYLDKGNPALADSLFRASLAIRRKQLGNDHPDVALALNNLATLIYVPQGRYAEADTLLTEALAICRQAFPEANSYTATALYSLGKVHALEGDLRQAEALLRESLAMRKTFLGETHPLVASTAMEVGVVLYKQRRYAEAVPFLESSLAHLKAAGEQTDEVVRHLVDLYDAWGKPEEAAAYRAMLAP